MIIFFLGNYKDSRGQIIDTLYYNNYWQLVTADSAKFYRIAEVDTINLWFTGGFQDYTVEGKLLMDGQYSKSGLKNGAYKSYYSTNKLYASGYFDNDLMAGTWSYYYPDGTLREKIRFTGYDFVVLEYYDPQGKHLVQNGTGRWAREMYLANGDRFTVSGRYTRTKRQGNWTLKDRQGNPILLEVYDNDYFLRGVVLDNYEEYYESRFTSEILYPKSMRKMESFLVWQATQSDYPYINWLPTIKKDSLPEINKLIQPDQAAFYPLGEEAFYRYIGDHLVYPEEARAAKIEGRVFVEFIVGTDGNLYNLQILKGIGGGCDQQAILAILNAGRWFPAKINGFPVEQRVVIPVSFRLLR